MTVTNETHVTHFLNLRRVNPYFRAIVKADMGPLFWVECFACNAVHPMHDGPRVLPKGWAALTPTANGEALHPEVYASPGCLRRASRIMIRAGASGVTIRHAEEAAKGAA